MDEIMKRKNKILSPTKDFVFQVLFGEVGNEQITKEFLEAILKEKIEKVDLSHNPILRRMKPDAKMGVLDVIAILDNNVRCNIELQMTKEEDIVERILYYWGRTYIRGIKKAEAYKSLDRTVSILIANFEIKGLEELSYCSRWKLIETEARKVILTDYMEVDIIELPKIRTQKTDKNDKLLEWLYFLINPESKEVKKIMEENEGIKKASQKLEEISQDEIMQRINDWKTMGEYNEEMGKRRAKEEGEKIGEARGKKIGEAEKQKEIAKRLKEENVSTEIIVKATGLTASEIEKL